jgi:hypothetical protein
VTSVDIGVAEVVWLLLILIIVKKLTMSTTNIFKIVKLLSQFKNPYELGIKNKLN